MKADAAARRDDVKAKIDKRNRELDAKAAAKEADWAEDDAIAALDCRLDRLRRSAGCAGRRRRPLLRRRARQGHGEPVRPGDELAEADPEPPTATRSLTLRTLAVRRVLEGMLTTLEREGSAVSPGRNGSKFVVLSPAMAPRMTPRSAP